MAHHDFRNCAAFSDAGQHELSPRADGELGSGGTMGETQAFGATGSCGIGRSGGPR